MTRRAGPGAASGGGSVSVRDGTELPSPPPPPTGAAGGGGGEETRRAVGGVLHCQPILGRTENAGQRGREREREGGRERRGGNRAETLSVTVQGIIWEAAKTGDRQHTTDGAWPVCRDKALLHTLTGHSTTSQSSPGPNREHVPPSTQHRPPRGRHCRTVRSLARRTHSRALYNGNGELNHRAVTRPSSGALTNIIPGLEEQSFRSSG